jgi:hypothetical protein
MLDTFSISEYFSEYKFMVIHNIEKASAHNCTIKKPACAEFGRGLRLEIENFRLHIEYLWNTVRREPRGRTIDLKKTERSDPSN